MARFVHNRGGFTASHRDEQEISTWKELYAILMPKWDNRPEFSPWKTRLCLEIKLHSDLPDERCGWPETWIVVDAERGVIGYADGPIEEFERRRQPLLNAQEA